MTNPLTAGGYVCGFLSAALAADACVAAFAGGRFDYTIAAGATTPTFTPLDPPPASPGRDRRRQLLWQRL